MHREIAADAVAGAVRVIEPRRPQELPRKRIELVAARPVGEDGARQRDVALENAREAVAHFRAWASDGEGSRHVGRPVAVLTPGVDEEQRV